MGSASCKVLAVGDALRKHRCSVCLGATQPLPPAQGQPTPTALLQAASLLEHQPCAGGMELTPGASLQDAPLGPHWWVPGTAVRQAESRGETPAHPRGGCWSVHAICSEWGQQGTLSPIRHFIHPGTRESPVPPPGRGLR